MQTLRNHDTSDGLDRRTGKQTCLAWATEIAPDEVPSFEAWAHPGALRLVTHPPRLRCQRCRRGRFSVPRQETVMNVIGGQNVTTVGRTRTIGGRGAPRPRLVEPTNHVSERALRPAVWWRKGSFAADASAHHMRVPIWTSEQVIGSDHCASMTLTSLMCRISAV
jgi:hypothetical protein